MTSPFVPPYLARRVRVAVIFEREISDAQRAGHEWVAAQPLQLRDEVLAALDPEISNGGDAHDEKSNRG